MQGPAGASPEAFEQLLHSRYSCRAFLPTPVERGLILRMLEMAQWTPSWCNVQPWQVIVTEGEGTERLRTALMEHAARAPPPSPDFAFPAEYHGVYRERRRESGRRYYASVGIAEGDRAASARQTMENFRLFGAPHAMIVTSDQRLGIYGALDIGFYLSNLTLAACSLGIATIPQAALAMHSDVIRKHFDLPEDRLIVCGVSFGRADAEHPANAFRTSRVEVKDVVTFCD